MQVAARVPDLDDQAFALGIPETIGCREALLVNFPEAQVEWQVGEESTTVSRLYLARGTLDEFLQRQAADRPGLAARQQWARPVEVTRDSKPHGRMEEMLPDQLEQVLAEAPIAFVPLGTYEHHGFHLPVCFDGIKAHALCERVAQRTGGTVLPTFFYGTGGGHVGYKWTLMLPEPQIVPLIEATLDHLARQGFKVVVLLTGHYPQEQVDMVHRLAQDAQRRHPQVKFIGLTEPEVTTPQPGDAYGGDHAAKYETSIAMALNPDWVHLGYSDRRTRSGPGYSAGHAAKGSLDARPDASTLRDLWARPALHGVERARRQVRGRNRLAFDRESGTSPRRRVARGNSRR